MPDSVLHCIPPDPRAVWGVLLAGMNAWSGTLPSCALVWETIHR